MKNYIEIEGRKIGSDFSPVVIAEIGINHGGKLSVAKEMVDAAYRAGVEIVKHQTHIVDDEMSHEAKNVIPGNSDNSIYDIMKSCALNEEEEYELMQYVRSKNMIFISTPFSRAAADRLNKFNVPAYKIGSGEMNHFPLIEYIASFGKPMIISTGMNSIPAVKKVVDIMKKYDTPFALLHTTNLYPTPPELVRLGAMLEMHNAFPDVPFGLSDHTCGNDACRSAIALGASVVERHFTDTMDRQGPDIICSMDEQSCAELIRSANDIFKMRGGKKEAAKEEQVTIDFAFATLVSIKPIKKGETFSLENLWAKRPGTGEIPAEALNNVIGKKALMDIPVDTHIKYSMIGD